MHIPSVDLIRSDQTYQGEIEAAMLGVIRSGRYIGGSEVKTFAARFAKYLGVKHAIGVSSGSDALLVSLLALNIGVGDEVITSPYSFFATVEAILRVGATPVFVDIEAETYALNATHVDAAITSRTKAIMPVHLFGQSADMPALMAVARKHNLAVIEDAAQATGSTYNGQMAGSFGEFGCFSFFPTKILGCMGDGGMVVTDDDALAALVQKLANHGASPKYYHAIVGGNFRLDAIQAAVLNVKLNYIEDSIAARITLAAEYDALFADAAIAGLSLPKIVRTRHAFGQYVIRVAQRDELQKHLQHQQIGCEIYYPLPLHLQACFSKYAIGDFPVSEHAAQTTIALPLFPNMQPAEQVTVVNAIAEFYQ